MNNTWSDTLIEKTHESLDDCFFAPDGFLHMKSANRKYGKIHRDDLIAKKWLIQDKGVDAEYYFTTIDELIEAGWAVD
jgi:hypothetical protein